MAIYLANSFSLGMLSGDALLCVFEFGNDYVKNAIQDAKDNVISAVGHQATADFMSSLLGIEVPVNRIAITLKPGDEVYVLQLMTRLPEGKILSQEELSQIKYKWFNVEVKDLDELLGD
jgi:hypothetical protein